VRVCAHACVQQHAPRRVCTRSITETARLYLCTATSLREGSSQLTFRVDTRTHALSQVVQQRANEGEKKHVTMADADDDEKRVPVRIALHHVAITHFNHARTRDRLALVIGIALQSLRHHVAFTFTSHACTGDSTSGSSTPYSHARTHGRRLSISIFHKVMLITAVVCGW
jgi:hypothetical protein